MLVLTRHIGEKLFVGDNITISIVRISGGQVRIGIDAPDDVLIRRNELVDQWQEEVPERGSV